MGTKWFAMSWAWEQNDAISFFTYNMVNGYSGDGLRSATLPFIFVKI